MISEIRTQKMIGPIILIHIQKMISIQIILNTISLMIIHHYFINVNLFKKTIQDSSIRFILELI